MDYFQHPLTKEIHFSLIDGHMWIDLNPECITDSFIGGHVLWFTGEVGWSIPDQYTSYFGDMINYRVGNFLHRYGIHSFLREVEEYLPWGLIRGLNDKSAQVFPNGKIIFIRVMNISFIRESTVLMVKNN